MTTPSWRTPALVLACGCIIMTITFGVRAGFGLFLQPMSLEYGWGREVFSLSMALQNLAWGALGAAPGGASFGIILAIIGRTVAPEKRSFAMNNTTSAGFFGQFALLPVTQF